MVTDHSSLAVFSPFYDALINSRCCDVARTPIFAIVWLLPLTWSSLAPNHDERCLRNLWDPIFTKPQILPDAIHTTQLRELLRSNVLPPAHLDATLRDVIHKAPVVLERYDAEIETLQNMLSGLVAERSSLAAHFEACRSVFSPIRRLPVELLAEVFEMCSPFNDQSSLSRDQYSSLPDPNTPGQELDRLAQCHLLVLSQVGDGVLPDAVRDLNLFSFIQRFPLFGTMWPLISRNYGPRYHWTPLYGRRLAHAFPF
jgi:hypothetical protein